MCRYPIELVNIGLKSWFDARAKVVTERLNSLQEQYHFSPPPSCHEEFFVNATLESAQPKAVWELLNRYRQQCKRLHPYVIAAIHEPLSSDRYLQLGASHSAKRGFAVVAAGGWPEQSRGGADELSSRVLLTYYIIRFLIAFACPEKRDHEAGRKCLFDAKSAPNDIEICSRKAELCDPCGTQVRGATEGEQFEALRAMIEHLRRLAEGKDRSYKKVLITSSQRGEEVASALQLGLDPYVDADLNPHTSFTLSSGTLDSFIQTVRKYDYAVVILTPEDHAMEDNKSKGVLPPNTLFELGACMGALGPTRTIMVTREGDDPGLPSYLRAIRTAEYRPRERERLSEAVQRTCSQIRGLVNESTL